MSKNNCRSPIHGWLVLDKPLGLTSTQALGRARRLLGGNKAGHGGTLDPLASGVLPLAFGEATKVIPFVIDGEKEYDFTIQWGQKRTTGDSEGEVIAQSESRPTLSQIQDTLVRFVGVIRQKPPAFSAIKVSGERAYDLARAGAVVDLPDREVVIHDLRLTTMIDNDSASFHVVCGKGMYVRSLASDIAEALGTCGYVAFLRRTKVGPFSLEKSVSIDDLECLKAENAALSALLPIKEAIDPRSVLNLTPNEAHSLQLGQKILIKPQHALYLGQKAVFTEYMGVPLALVEPFAGEFRVLRGFHFGAG